ncbi:MAG: hypothetical protein MUF53_13280 [Gemmatimonadaceae bacterium]|nr:hypothetical protein [Gemmatimonadaceae bacterium]
MSEPIWPGSVFTLATSGLLSAAVTRAPSLPLSSQSTAAVASAPIASTAPATTQPLRLLPSSFTCDAA